MPGVTVPDWVIPATLALFGVAVVGWNFALGARITALPQAGRAFRALSGMGAFLLLPALVIGVLAPTTSGARVLQSLAWLWPLVAAGVATQAWWALVTGRGRVFVVLPIAVFDSVVACIAATRWLEGLGVAVPAWLLAPGLAVSSMGARALGDGAFLWSAAVLIPSLAPAARARWRLSAAWRAIMATACTIVVVLISIGLPDAYRAILAPRRAGADLMPERARSDFSVGLRLYGTLSGAPSWTTARHDAALADSMGVTAVHIEIGSDGASASALDSVARSLEARRDSTVLIVTFDLAPGYLQPFRPDEAWMRTRLGIVERIVQRLHPDVLVPAEGLPRTADLASVTWWQRYYERVARSARRIDRDVSVALATDAASAADSALCDWVMRGDSPVDAMALSVRAHDGQPARFERAVAAMDRWVSLARVSPSVWLVGVPTAPAISGELAQQRLVHRALLWGASRAWVRGVIAGDASDVLASTGLRTATGRSRGALAEVGAALRALREAPDPVPVAVDSVRTTPSTATPTPPPPDAS